MDLTRGAVPVVTAFSNHSTAPRGWRSVRAAHLDQRPCSGRQSRQDFEHVLPVLVLRNREDRACFLLGFEAGRTLRSHETGFQGPGCVRGVDRPPSRGCARPGQSRTSSVEVRGAVRGARRSSARTSGKRRPLARAISLACGGCSRTPEFAGLYCQVHAAWGPTPHTAVPGPPPGRAGRSAAWSLRRHRVG